MHFAVLFKQMPRLIALSSIVLIGCGPSTYNDATEAGASAHGLGSIVVIDIESWARALELQLVKVGEDLAAGARYRSTIEELEKTPNGGVRTLAGFRLTEVDGAQKWCADEANALTAFNAAESDISDYCRCLGVRHVQPADGIDPNSFGGFHRALASLFEGRIFQAPSIVRIERVNSCFGSYTSIGQFIPKRTIFDLNVAFSSRYGMQAQTFGAAAVRLPSGGIGASGSTIIPSSGPSNAALQIVRTESTPTLGSINISIGAVHNPNMSLVFGTPVEVPQPLLGLTDSIRFGLQNWEKIKSVVPGLVSSLVARNAGAPGISLRNITQSPEQIAQILFADAIPEWAKETPLGDVKAASNSADQLPVRFNFPKGCKPPENFRNLSQLDQNRAYIECLAKVFDDEHDPFFKIQLNVFDKDGLKFITTSDGQHRILALIRRAVLGNKSTPKISDIPSQQLDIRMSDKMNYSGDPRFIQSIKDEANGTPFSKLYEELFGR